METAPGSILSLSESNSSTGEPSSPASAWCPLGKASSIRAMRTRHWGLSRTQAPPPAPCSREDGHIHCFKWIFKPITVYLFRYLTAQVLSLYSSLENSKSGTKGAARDCKVSAVPRVPSVRTLLRYLSCRNIGASIDSGGIGNARLLEAVVLL